MRQRTACRRIGCAAALTVGLLLGFSGLQGYGPARHTAEAMALAQVGSGLYDETVFVGSGDHKIYAVDGHTGNLDWSFATGGPVWSAPAVANGMVYAGSSDDNVYALNAATGSPVWRFKTGGWVWGALTVDDGTIYVSSRDGAIYALNGRTGAKLWSFKTGGPVLTSPAIQGNVLYAGSDDHRIYALDRRTGHLLWDYQTGLDVVSSPAVANGVVFVGSDDGTLYALNAASGTLIWDFTTSGPIESSPTVAQGSVYVGSNDGRIYALTAATGMKLWSYTTGNWVVASPAIAGSDVYIGSLDHNVYALDAHTGDRVWSFQTNSQVWATPTIARGVVYVGSLDHNLYALDALNGQQDWLVQTAGAVYPTTSILETPTPAAPALPVVGARYFPQTQHNMSGRFLAFYRKYGGLSIFGYPRTEPFIENGHLVQETDRFLLELVNGHVSTAPLGSILTQGETFNTAPSFTSSSSHQYFSSTQHSLSGVFLIYWHTHYGAVVLGAPISEPFQGQNGDGTKRQYVMQWFQQGRLEFHPELAGTPYVVELGLAGKEDLARRGWTP